MAYFLIRFFAFLQLIFTATSLTYRTSIFRIVKPKNVPQLISKYNAAENTEKEISINFVNNFVGKDTSSVLTLPSLFAFGALLFPCDSAFADANSIGILAVRTASMVHPITNLALFAISLYTAYLGFQWRRLRDIGNELRVLNSQLPNISSGKLSSPISATLSSLLLELEALKVDPINVNKIEVVTSDISIINKAAELDSKITELTSIRKDLISLNLRDKHYSTGSTLLGLGVATSFLGAFNTFIREGEIFPDSHLFAGMSITALWAGM